MDQMILYQGAKNIAGFADLNEEVLSIEYLKRSEHFVLQAFNLSE